MQRNFQEKNKFCISNSCEFKDILFSRIIKTNCFEFYCTDLFIIQNVAFTAIYHSDIQYFKTNDDAVTLKPEARNTISIFISHKSFRLGSTF